MAWNVQSSTTSAMGLKMGEKLKSGCCAEKADSAGVV